MQNGRCRYCHNPRPEGYSITCGASECQEEDARQHRMEMRGKRRARSRFARQALAASGLLNRKAD